MTQELGQGQQGRRLGKVEKGLKGTLVPRGSAMVPCRRDFLLTECSRETSAWGLLLRGPTIGKNTGPHSVTSLKETLSEFVFFFPSTNGIKGLK